MSASETENVQLSVPVPSPVVSSPTVGVKVPTKPAVLDVTLTVCVSVRSTSVNATWPEVVWMPRPSCGLPSANSVTTMDVPFMFRLSPSTPRPPGTSTKVNQP